MFSPKGKFGWYELMTSDTEAAGKFYSDVVGWTTQEMPGGDGQPYTIFNIGSVGIAALYSQESERLVDGHLLRLGARADLDRVSTGACVDCFLDGGEGRARTRPDPARRRACHVRCKCAYSCEAYTQTDARDQFATDAAISVAHSRPPLVQDRFGCATSMTTLSSKPHSVQIIFFNYFR